jgi:hypothetical protein
MQNTCEISGTVGLLFTIELDVTRILKFLFLLLIISHVDILCNHTID